MLNWTSDGIARNGGAKGGRFFLLFYLFTFLPLKALLPFYLFTFLPFRKEAEELGIYLIYDFTKLLGIVLEIEIINFYDKHLTLILIHDKIFVKIVDTLQIIQRHLLLIITTTLLDILHEVRN